MRLPVACPTIHLLSIVVRGVAFFKVLFLIKQSEAMDNARKI